MAMSPLRIKEDRIRRALVKHGHKLHKTPGRSWLRTEYGPGYEVTDSSGEIVLGYRHGDGREYAASIEQVERFLAKLGAPTPQSRK